MGIAITGLAVGFVLLYDIQQEKEVQSIWIQKIPTQCNDVWEEEYNDFYEINPEIQKATDEELKEVAYGLIYGDFSPELLPRQRMLKARLRKIEAAKEAAMPRPSLPPIEEDPYCEEYAWS